MRTILEDVHARRPLHYIEMGDGGTYEVGVANVESLELIDDCVHVEIAGSTQAKLFNEESMWKQPRTVVIPWHSITRLDFVEPLPDEEAPSESE